MKFIKFSQIFDFQKKSKIKAGDGLRNGTFPFFTSSPILSKYVNSFQFDKDSLIFGTGGNVSVHVYTKPFSVSTDCLVAQLKYDLIKKFRIKFVYYYLIGNIWILEKGFKGAGLKHISKDYINNIDIPELSVEDQERIVKILDEADVLRQKRKQAIELLDDYLNSVFLEMFGKNLTEGTMRIGKHLKVIGGGTFKSTDFVGSGVPVIKIGTINKGFFDLNNGSFLPTVFLRNHRNEKYIIYPDDLLISLTGTVGKDDYGNVCIVTAKYPQYLLNQRVAKLDFDKTTFKKEFLFYFFKAKQIKSQLTKISRGVRQANISNEDILSLVIDIPSMDLQSKFSGIVKKSEGIKETMFAQSVELETQFQVLIQRAFKGEL